MNGKNFPSAEQARPICDRYSALAEAVAKLTGKLTTDAIKAVHQVAACTEPASPESGRPPTRTHWHALYYPERRKLHVSFYLGEEDATGQSNTARIRRSSYLEFSLTPAGHDQKQGSGTGNGDG